MTEAERRRRRRIELWEQMLIGIDLAGKTVLDAGSGEGHFTRFLAERNPGRLVSITCNPDDWEKAKQTVGPWADRVDWRIEDLTRMTSIPTASFDVVGAEFLIAAVAAITPYREIDCLQELLRVLRPGGRLLLTGWQIWPQPRNRLDAQLRRLFSFREAVHRLRLEEGFREHPLWWIEARLAELQAPVERTVVLPDVHYDLSWFLRQIDRAIDEIEPPTLRQALHDRLRQEEVMLADHAADLAAGFAFGELYAASACKLQGAVLL